MRHGTWVEDGFEAPEYGTILHKLTDTYIDRREHTSAHNVFEMRQTPSALGLGLIESISDETILALADPTDEDGDGIMGVAHVMPDGRLGRFGWKAQVPSIREFIRDAMSAEVGVSVPDEDGPTFGFLTDDDGVADPEISVSEIDAMEFFLALAAPPAPAQDVPAGRQVFEDIGCQSCHVPELMGADGPVPLYSDLLLHDVAPADYDGIPDGVADGRQFRTPPLWGLRFTAPYMHDGMATTVQDAIEAHAGEATGVVDAYNALSDDDRNALIEFLENL